MVGSPLPFFPLVGHCDLFHAKHDRAGNLPLFPPIFSDQRSRRSFASAPVRLACRAASGGRGKPVEKPVSDQVKIRGHGRAGFAVARPQRLEHAAGLVLRGQELLSLGILRHCRDQSLELGRGPCGHRRGAAQETEGSAGGRPVQSPTCARKSPVGTSAAAVKRICWDIILAWWSRHRVRYATRPSSESPSG